MAITWRADYNPFICPSERARAPGRNGLERKKKITGTTRSSPKISLIRFTTPIVSQRVSLVLPGAFRGEVHQEPARVPVLYPRTSTPRMGFSPEDAIRGVEVLKSSGYSGRLLVNLSLNAPGETRETLLETIGVVKRIRLIFGDERVVPVIFFLALEPDTGLERRPFWMDISARVIIRSPYRHGIY